MEQLTVNFVLGVGLAVMGWFARELWAAVKELKSDLSRLREEFPSHYVRKDDWEKEIDRIHKKLDKIFDRLDSKADK